jgi:mono/diheme cytochrome c family protein
MKKQVIIFSYILILLWSCNQTADKSSITFKPEALTSQIFSINVNKDTTLHTEKGAIISIPAGAFTTNGTEKLQLEVKEAYTVSEIIMAGLTTQNNGYPLSSGGMIYLNPVGSKTIKLAKPVSIKIPTQFIDKRMQLFKGKIASSGNINWTKSDSLSTNSDLSGYEAGRTLFMNNCATCHGIGKDGTGPDLAHILKRTKDKNLLYAYTRNNQEILHSGNLYYRCLFSRWNKLAMNNFPSITNEALDNIYGYIENESYTRNLPEIKDEISPCIDSCILYGSLKYKLDQAKGKLTEKAVDMVIEETRTTINNLEALDRQYSPTITGPNNKIVPNSHKSLYYQFTINETGWFNIDVLLDEKYGAVESSLIVKLTGQYSKKTNIYLVIPSVKVFTPGGLLTDKKDEYGFFTKDGNIHLPQHIKAYILVMGEYEDKIVFAKQEFLTSQSQNFEIQPELVSQQDFSKSINALSISDVIISINKTEIADSLRSIISQLNGLERIKPKNCDCDCFFLGEGTWRSYPTDTTALK